MDHPKIKVFYGDKARNIVRKKIAGNHFSHFIDEWLTENYDVECHILLDRDSLVSFALVAKPFDPNHPLPGMINYFYTVPKFRNQGYMTKLVENIQLTHNSLVTFTDNNISDKILGKLGWKEEGMGWLWTK